MKPSRNPVLRFNTTNLVKNEVRKANNNEMSITQRRESLSNERRENIVNKYYQPIDKHSLDVVYGLKSVVPQMYPPRQHRTSRPISN